MMSDIKGFPVFPYSDAWKFVNYLEFFYISA